MNAEQTAARDRQVLQLRTAGVTFEQIARQLKFANRSSAWKAYQRALDLVLPESLDESKKLELARLDAMYAALWAKALKGDVAAVDRCLKITEKRIGIIGLDAPPARAAGEAPSSGSDPLDDLATRRAARRSEA